MLFDLASLGYVFLKKKIKKIVVHFTIFPVFLFYVMRMRRSNFLAFLNLHSMGELVFVFGLFGFCFCRINI